MADDIAFHDVDSRRWDDLARLFQSRGGPKNCWCMVWRATPAEGKHTDGVSRRAALASRVDRGVPVGILGYLAGEPVAWCSVAPRTSYRPLGGPDERGEDPEHVWSIACFFITRKARGQGVSERLLSAAIALARQKGARVVEAYPVDPQSPSYRFMGFLGLFERAGFTLVGRAGARRHVVRLRLSE